MRRPFPLVSTRGRMREVLLQIRAGINSTERSIMVSKIYPDARELGRLITEWRGSEGWSRPRLNEEMRRTDLLPTKITTAAQIERLTDLIRKWEKGLSWPQRESAALQKALRADPDDTAALPARCRAWQAVFLDARRHTNAVESDEARAFDHTVPSSPLVNSPSADSQEATHFLKFLEILYNNVRVINHKKDKRLHGPLNNLLQQMVQYSLKKEMIKSQLDILATQYIYEDKFERRKEILRIFFLICVEKNIVDLPNAIDIGERLNSPDETVAVRAALDAHEWMQPHQKPWSDERAFGVAYFINSLINNIQRNGNIAEISALTLTNLTYGFSMTKQGIELDVDSLEKIINVALAPGTSPYVVNHLSLCISKCYLNNNPDFYRKIEIVDYLYKWAMIADGAMRRSSLPARQPATPPPDAGGWLQRFLELHDSSEGEYPCRGIAVLLARMGVAHAALVPSYEILVNDPDTSFWLREEVLAYLAYYGGDRGQAFLLALAKQMPGNPSPGRDPDPQHGFLAIVGAGNDRSMRQLFELAARHDVYDAPAITYAVATKDRYGVLRLVTLPWWRAPRMIRIVRKAMWRALF